MVGGHTAVPLGIGKTAPATGVGFVYQSLCINKHLGRVHPPQIP